MPIIVRRGDYTIEVSSEEELRTVLKVLGDTQQLALPEIPPANNGAAPTHPVVSTADAAQRAWRTVKNPNALEYLRVLARHTDGLNDTEFKRLLGGLEKNNQLAAKTTAVVRAFKRAGVDPDTFLIRERTGEPGSRTYTYKLADVLREIITREP